MITLPMLWRGRGQHRAIDRVAVLEAQLSAVRAKLAAADALITRQCERNAALEAANQALQRAHRTLAAELNTVELAAVEPDSQETQEIPIRVVPLWGRPTNYGPARVPQMADTSSGQAA